MLKKSVSGKLGGAVMLLTVLLSAIFVVPSIQLEIYGQQQQQQQEQQQKVQHQKVSISKIINQIGQRVADANPDTNSTLVQQVIVQLAKHTAQTSSKAQANKEIREIASQVDKYPNGIISRLLSHFAQELTLEEGEVGYDDALAAEEMSSVAKIRNNTVR
jgi:hypothetical protein